MEANALTRAGNKKPRLKTVGNNDLIAEDLESERT